jgi:hypothetical protein
MKHLNNFYFKMLIKSAKMTHNMNNDNVFKDIMSYFTATNPMILPHVWLNNSQYCNRKWNDVYLKLIKERFIKDTITLIKTLKNIDIEEEIVETAFNRRTVLNTVFRNTDSYNKFYYQ